MNYPCHPRGLSVINVISLEKNPPPLLPGINFLRMDCPTFRSLLNHFVIAPSYSHPALYVAVWTRERPQSSAWTGQLSAAASATPVIAYNLFGSASVLRIYTLCI